MSLKSSLLAISAVFAFATTASAQVTGATGSPLGTILGLSGPAICSPSCTLGTTVGTITGGQTRSTGVSGIAAMPTGTSGNFLAAGPDNNGVATLTLNTGVVGIGFLWGTPDTYNTLTVFTTGGSKSFLASGVGISPVNGSGEQYVVFTAAAGQTITKLTFNSGNSNAFEVANFTVRTSTVPEPSTYALMGAGLVGLGAAAKRRKRA